MSILSFISNLFGPAERIIDELNTSEQEKLELRNELAKIQMQIHSKTTDLMIAEAKSEHWFVSAWRPLTITLLILIILLGAFNVIVCPPEVYSLTELFLSVYAGGRSVEKIARNIKK